MKRREYSGYDDYVPYRNDWRYSVGLFSVIMFAVIGYSYWKLSPDETKVVQAVAKTVAMAKKPARDSTVSAKTVAAQPTEMLKPRATAPIKVKHPARPERHVPTSSQPTVKPEKMKPVTGPAGQ